MRFLRSQGINVSGFLDAKATAGGVFEDAPVFTLDKWLSVHGTQDVDVLISIHSHAVDVAPIIDTLRAAGFSRVLTMVDYANLFPEDAADRYWLVPSAFYADKQEEIATVRGFLSDSISQHWFDAILTLRQQANYHDLPMPRPAEQYVSPDLPRWQQPMRLIDCGAYDGDSIKIIQNSGYDIEDAIAFEPDADTYAKLIARLAGLKAAFLPCGVSSTAEVIRFDAGLGAASRADGNGEIAIQCVAIDEAFPAFAPTLIKMDIEGGKPAALRGAERTICQCRPGLAISLYHRPEHLWEIPLWIANLDVGYKMYLRGHSHSGYDLVLYCVADPQ
jgi:FkbM family methyltransferase